MAMVGVYGGSYVDSQPSSVGLVCGLVATRRRRHRVASEGRSVAPR